MKYLSLKIFPDEKKQSILKNLQKLSCHSR